LSRNLSKVWIIFKNIKNKGNAPFFATLMPKPTRAGADSNFIQNEIQLTNTQNIEGLKFWFKF